jgi:acetyl esterase/lipase
MRWLLLSLALILVILLPASSVAGLAGMNSERDIIYRLDQDITLKMDLFFPENTENVHPAILYVHGGGWYSGDKADDTCREDITELVRHGYIVACANYRLAPRYKFPAQIEDLHYALDFLQLNAAIYGIDPDRIGLMGDSAGGQLAALLGLTCNNRTLEPGCECCSQPFRIKAVADLYGPSDLTAKFERDRDMLMEHVFATCDPESEIIKEASPINHVTAEAPPFLLIHGEEDEVVLASQSMDMYRALESAGVPASLVIVENAGHEFVPVDAKGETITPTRSQISELIVGFFDKYLK